jgi:hypothetical protein
MLIFGHSSFSAASPPVCDTSTIYEGRGRPMFAVPQTRRGVLPLQAASEVEYGRDLHHGPTTSACGVFDGVDIKTYVAHVQPSLPMMWPSEAAVQAPPPLPVRAQTPRRTFVSSHALAPVHATGSVRRHISSCARRMPACVPLQLARGGPCGYAESPTHPQAATRLPVSNRS